MQAGKLRHRVTIQTATQSQDAYGEADRTWSDADTVWASVSPASSRELVQGRQVQAETTHTIRMRYHEDAAPTARLKFGSRTFNIVRVHNIDERNIELEIEAAEIV
jgi:SPP1 family predicted phage head-tail adaptor